MKPITTYLATLAPEDRAPFAARCGTSVNYLRKASSTGQKIGESLCIALERESAGAIRCEVLRPDVDWAYLRNTTQQAPVHTRQLPPAAESVACPANLVSPPGALRAGTIRRHVSRRAQEAAAERDRRAKGGPPFQSLETGVA